MSGANPHRHKEEEGGATAQTSVTTALEPGQQLVAADGQGDMQERVKHERAQHHHDAHEPKHDKNYNRAPDVKRTHQIQQPGNHHQ